MPTSRHAMLPALSLFVRHIRSKIAEILVDRSRKQINRQFTPLDVSLMHLLDIRVSFINKETIVLFGTDARKCSHLNKQKICLCTPIVGDLIDSRSFLSHRDFSRPETQNRCTRNRKGSSQEELYRLWKYNLNTEQNTVNSMIVNHVHCKLTNLSELNTLTQTNLTDG